MKRTIFSPDHELFRQQFRRYAEAEVAPHVERWNRQGISDREAWRAMGAAGYLGVAMPEAYGGAGGDFLYAAIVTEELCRIRAHALQVSLHSDICLPYLVSYTSEAQKERFLRPAISGDKLVAIAMTEPGTGSDLAAVQTRAVRQGDAYVVDGSKTFISNGQNADLVIVVVKTDPEAQPARRGISLLLVEADRPGFSRGRNLEKLGLKGQDTSELFFSGCRVPAENLLGEEGQGFRYLMEKLQQERLILAVGSIASCQRSLADTIAYVKERRAFGRPVATFQNTQFTLAELATEVQVGQTFIDQLMVAHARGESLVTEVSMAKLWVTELQKRLTSRCLQLFGGYGFMDEYPISADYADAAVQTIYGGTSEIMKLIIARQLGLDDK
ncbi:MAG: acyl-CoA dehydrogenase family protein [Myxococcales bacterium]|nr:acyl-CoA dehydrogenase family protein [Myxococcales bacterium]MDD9967501.1 acyl-CoA dehydrogenase family protein [Myxococcales bacterium]